MTAATQALRRLAARRALLGGLALAVLVELLPGAPQPLPAVAGLWLLLGAPMLLWYGVAARAVSTPDGRFLLAAGLAVLGDIVTALAVNTALPWAGVERPLARLPLTLAAALAVLVTAALVRAPAVAVPRRMPPGARPVLAAGAVALTLSVAGPIRLNNGLGGAVSVAALVAVAALFVLLAARRRRWPAGVLGLGLYLAAASLLLLTSLRGWYITGHDIQREYEVFRLTAGADRWSIAAFRDPYNACLSITLLPTALTKLTGVSGTYVFKAVLPLLFALTPVTVYRSVRNAAPQIVALLSAVYFMAFPTFFTDMTFLARQEVAFLLLGCAMVVLTDAARPLRARRVMVTVLLVGIALCHYSTTYVVVATLGTAVLTAAALRVASRPRERAAGRTAFVTWRMVAVAAAAAVVWAGPVTHTTGQARLTLTATVRGLLGEDTRSGSSDTAYSLFGGASVTPAQRLAEYRADTVERTAAIRAEGGYLPLSVTERWSTPVVDVPAMPLTSLGRAVERTGLDVTAANGFVRQAVAALLQLLLLLGVVVTRLARRRRGFRPTRDQLALTAGAVAVMAALTVLPELSVDYGVLRAFQQGLFFFAPYLAAGSLWLCRWAGRRAVPVACALALACFLDLTGVVPKLLGGYPAQLHLSNTGQYYDIYYVHPEERSAISWLQSHTPEHEHGDIQSEVQTDRYTFSRLQTLIRGRALNDIYPTLVGADSYVFLGTTTVLKDDATVFYRGDLVTYRYPVGLLDATKNKLYSSEGAEIYR